MALFLSASGQSVMFRGAMQFQMSTPIADSDSQPNQVMVKKILRMMTAYRGNTFGIVDHITDPLWAESIGHLCIPLTNHQ